MSEVIDSAKALSAICAELNGNDDLLGIGVRISFYLQILLTSIIAILPGADFIGSSWGISASFWALFFSATIQWSKGTFTLFQAIITSYLLYLHALASTLCAGPCYAHPLNEKDNSTSPMILVSVALLHLAAGVFGIFTALKGAAMGPSTECNEAARLQILWFTLKPAGRDKRYIFTFAFAYLAICCMFQAFQLASWIKKKDERRPFTPNWLVVTLKHFSKDPNVVNSIGKNTNMDLEKRMKDFIMIGGWIWWLSILNIERTIRMNDVEMPSAKGFGQILALFTIAIPIEAIAGWVAFKNLELKRQGQTLPGRVAQVLAWLGGLLAILTIGPLFVAIIYGYNICRRVREYHRRRSRKVGNSGVDQDDDDKDDWVKGIELKE